MTSYSAQDTIISVSRYMANCVLLYQCSRYPIFRLISLFCYRCTFKYTVSTTERLCVHEPHLQFKQHVSYFFHDCLPLQPCSYSLTKGVRRQGRPNCWPLRSMRSCKRLVKKKPNRPRQQLPPASVKPTFSWAPTTRGPKLWCCTSTDWTTL